MSFSLSHFLCSSFIIYIWDWEPFFFKCINSGAATISELEVLANDFNLTEVKPKSKEQELLITLLIDIDQPGILSESVTSMRKDTMFHVLNFIKNNFLG